jgi:hypothetical protein
MTIPSRHGLAERISVFGHKPRPAIVRVAAPDLTVWPDGILSFDSEFASPRNHVAFNLRQYRNCSPRRVHVITPEADAVQSNDRIHPPGPLQRLRDARILPGQNRTASKTPVQSSALNGAPLLPHGPERRLSFLRKREFRDTRRLPDSKPTPSFDATYRSPHSIPHRNRTSKNRFGRRSGKRPMPPLVLPLGRRRDE